MTFRPRSAPALRTCRKGNFAVITALVAPLLIGTVGGVVDIYVFHQQQKALQAAADAAALAATREASLKGWRTETAEAVVDLYVASNVQAVGEAELVSSVKVDEAERTVSVTLEQDHYGYFVLGLFKGHPQIRVHAAAQTSGDTNICVIGLDQTANSTISLKTSARLTAPSCAVYSNSVSPSGLSSEANANVMAGLACTAGGFVGAPKNFTKPPITDCPIVEDPLLQRPPPLVPTVCTEAKIKIMALTVLSPGVYCGGLNIKDNDIVALKPGIYVIKDGKLKVGKTAYLKGKGVGFYFTGNGSHFEFVKEARVDLEAPSTGSMAGILMFQDRASAEANFKITSDFAHNLLGTIYLPNGNLVVDADNRVADRSAYTAIVVKSLHLDSAPNLVLNTNYDGTAVPVPEGVGPSEGLTKLVK